MNSIIEKKVEEFLFTDEDCTIQEVRDQVKQEQKEWLRQALTDMYEMGLHKESHLIPCEHCKEIGAADMKKRILEELDKCLNIHSCNPNHINGKVFSTAIKSVHSQ